MRMFRVESATAFESAFELEAFPALWSTAFDPVAAGGGAPITPTVADGTAGLELRGGGLVWCAKSPRMIAAIEHTSPTRTTGRRHQDKTRRGMNECAFLAARVNISNR